MSVTSIQRDANNNVCIVRITADNTTPEILAPNYIANQQSIIDDLNGGSFQWFYTDTLLISATDQNGFFNFTDETFTSLVLTANSTDGTVAPGLQDQLAFYPANGTVLQGTYSLPALCQVSPQNLNQGTNANNKTFYRGDGVWAEVSESDRHSVYSVYVSPDGSNIDGDGSVNNPYQTIVKALSEITTNDSTHIFNIILSAGYYNETLQIRLKPWVNLIGYGINTVINNSSAIILDNSWDSSLNGTIAIENLTIENNLSLDFSTVPSSDSPVVNVNNIQINGTFLIEGNAVNPNIFFIRSSFINTAVFNNAVIQSWDNYYFVSFASGLSTFTTSTLFNSIGDIYNSTVALFGAPSGLTTQTFDINSSELKGTLNVTGTKATLNIDVSSYIVPTILSGATVNLKSISDGLKANYSPSNYTPIATPPDSTSSLHAHLRGIDGALSGVSPSPYTFVYRYVTSTGGVDAPTSGSINDPYATISYATSQITDNTSSKRYILFCCGVFNEANMKLKPFVFVLGNKSSLNFTNPLTLDATFAASNTGILDGFDLTGNISLDFTSLPLSKIYITNNSVATGLPTWTITGSSSFFISATIYNNTSASNPFNLTMTNCSATLFNNHISTLTLTQDNGAASAANATISGGSFAILNLLTTSTKAFTVRSNSVYTSTLSISAASTGVATFNGVGCGKFTGVSLSGASTSLVCDVLSVTPSFSGGAVDGTNVIYPSLSASLTAGFTPSNYTVANTRVRAHLEGIDSSLSYEVTKFLEVTGTSQSVTMGTAYVANNASLVNFTLPATIPQGAILEISYKGAGGFRITANTGQTIQVGSSITSSAGTVTSSTVGAAIRLRCITANTVLEQIGGVGSFSLT